MIKTIFLFSDKNFWGIVCFDLSTFLEGSSCGLVTSIGFEISTSVGWIPFSGFETEEFTSKLSGV